MYLTKSRKRVANQESGTAKWDRLNLNDSNLSVSKKKGLFLQIAKCVTLLFNSRVCNTFHCQVCMLTNTQAGTVTLAWMTTGYKYCFCHCLLYSETSSLQWYKTISSESCRMFVNLNKHATDLGEYDIIYYIR